jgi:hypothetical protein
MNRLQGNKPTTIDRVYPAAIDLLAQHNYFLVPTPSDVSPRFCRGGRGGNYILMITYEDLQELGLVENIGWGNLPYKEWKRRLLNGMQTLELRLLIGI